MACGRSLKDTLVFGCSLLELLAFHQLCRVSQTCLCLQFIEVDRALDNLAKSGKLFNLPSRRDSMPVMGGPRHSEFGMSRSWILKNMA